MELGLSLGDAPRRFSHGTFMERADKIRSNSGSSTARAFCMGLDVVESAGNGREEKKGRNEDDDDGGANSTTVKDNNIGPISVDAEDEEEEGDDQIRVSADPPVQLDLLPLAPVPRNSSISSQLGLPIWLSRNSNSEASSGHLGAFARGFDVNRLPSAEEMNEGATVSSPNSTLSSFQMDFSITRDGTNKRDLEAAAIELDAERTSSRASDEEENGLNRKKLRLSKEQSAFLEESFKEHNTLNPKQKLALAKQLNLRPRQVEVWFQNRRARTKLKQTEVDCEYLKRCCETLTEENRRLQKELQELRTLKTSNPFYMQLPATTLTMCPSCERVATTSATADKSSSGAAAAGTTTGATKATAFSLAKPMFYPFSQAHSSAAS